MLIEDQSVKVNIANYNIKHYKNLGYDCKIGESIYIPVEHLTKGSNVCVNVKCDYCNEIITKRYREYINSRQSGLDCCKKCCLIKRNEVIKNKYGVESVLQLENIKEKSKATSLAKYGVEYYNQSEEGKNKRINTCLNKYGVDNPAKLNESKEKAKRTNLLRYGVENSLSSPLIREKCIETCIKKYGVKNFRLSDEYREKTIETSMAKYGCDYYTKSPIIIEKRNKTFFKNGTTRTSSQQIELHKMIQDKYQDALLNYPCGRSIFDIALFVSADVKIDVEYDGSFWHKNQQNDRRRDEYFKSQGWKILRIKSGHKLPTKEQLQAALDCLINTEHRYNEIVLDDWDLDNVS